MSGTGSRINALASFTAHLPKMDLVGPTVDDDIQRAIYRYGSEAVQSATKRLTAKKRGRPKINDFRELAPIIEEEANIWLQGDDPFSARSNYAIAKEYADQNPGHNHAATMQRLEKKLGRKRHGRKWYVLATALNRAEADYPYAQYIRCLEALSSLDSSEIWSWLIERAQAIVRDYTDKFGEPAHDLTFEQIKEEAKKPINALAPYSTGHGRGIFGLPNRQE
jgi:hypothetical protein